MQHPLRKGPYIAQDTGGRWGIGATDAVGEREAVLDMIQVDVVAPDYRVESLSADVEELRQMIQARPRIVPVQDLDSPEHRLRMPIHAEVEVGEGSVTAYCADLQQYGDGVDDEEAIDCLRRRIAEEYEFLRENQPDLGPGMAKLWGRFDRLIERVEA